MLELDGIRKAYGDKLVLDDFSFAFPESGTVALLGPSGCGKTTLLRVIAGLEKPDSGTVILPECAKIAVVFQEDRLLDSLDVRGNVLAVTGNSGYALADRCLDRCGLSDAAAEYPASLSGGMKRRVAIARAIAYSGTILLLDEPFKGLDNTTKQKVAEFVFEDAKNRLTILITHDRQEADAFADKILCFSGIPLRLMEEFR